MKKMMVCLFVLVLPLVAFSKGKEKRDCILEDLATSGLGDVKYSVLSEAQFQAVNGDEWALMRGQAFDTLVIEDGNNSIADYIDEQFFSTTNLPDGRGLFLRGRNNGREDGYENPAGELLLGIRQDDAFQAHFHDYYLGSTQENFNHLSSYDQFAMAHNDGGHYLRSVMTSEPQDIINLPTSTGLHGDVRYDVETRPRNLTVNIFVKVKRKCIDANTISEIDANTARIDALETYNASNVCDTCLTMDESDLTALNAKHTCFETEIDAYEADQRDWSVSCVARTVGYSKKVLMLIGSNRTDDQNTYLSHLDNQYPYYNVISTN